MRLEQRQQQQRAAPADAGRPKKHTRTKTHLRLGQLVLQPRQLLPLLGGSLGHRLGLLRLGGRRREARGRGRLGAARSLGVALRRGEPVGLLVGLLLMVMLLTCAFVGVMMGLL